MNDSGRPKTLIEVSTAEIKIQQLVYLLIIFPIAGLFFPAITLYWIVYAFITLSVQLHWLPENIHSGFLDNWAPFIGTAMTVAIAFCLFMLIRKAKSANAVSGDRRLKPVPAIEKGQQLNARVTRIWEGIGNTKPVPEVLWFVNFNVLARASVIGVHQIVEVSSGLWERVTQDDWLSGLILAHEMAHLIHGDIRRFHQIDTLTLAVRNIVRVLLGLSAAALIFAWIYDLSFGMQHRETYRLMLIHLAGGPVVALFVLLPLVVGGWVIRRYAGFIISLMELRADVTAQIWVGTATGADTEQTTDPAVHQTSLKELGNSLVSLNLTHISETERFNILRSKDRMLTPKLRYFALSLLLALLIPLNSFTPMLSEGAIDQLFIAAAVIALHIVTFSMLVTSPAGMYLSPRRSVIMALALYMATGLAAINAYQFGYYLTELGASFFAPNGFADKLLDWPSLGKDFRTSLGGMAGEFTAAYHPFPAVLCIIFSAILIYVASRMLSNSKIRFRWLGLILVLFAALLATYDPSRGDWYPDFLSGPASWLIENHNFADIRYILPAFSIFIYALLMHCLLIFKK